MEKQKICIIGGSLAGLTTAISLSKLDCEIDLVTGDSKKSLNSSRTVAISESNLNFLKKLNIFESKSTAFWPCTVMKLYTELSKYISQYYISSIFISTIVLLLAVFIAAFIPSISPEMTTCPGALRLAGTTTPC